MHQNNEPPHSYGAALRRASAEHEARKASEAKAQADAHWAEAKAEFRKAGVGGWVGLGVVLAVSIGVAGHLLTGEGTALVSEMGGVTAPPTVDSQEAEIASATAKADDLAGDANVFVNKVRLELERCTKANGPVTAAQDMLSLYQAAKAAETACGEAAMDVRDITFSDSADKVVTEQAGDALSDCSLALRTISLTHGAFARAVERRDASPATVTELAGRQDRDGERLHLCKQAVDAVVQSVGGVAQLNETPST